MKLFATRRYLLGSLAMFSICNPAGAEPLMHVVTDDSSGQSVIREGNSNVLQFNHQTIQPPPDVLAKIAPDNQRYARPRSDYIHPLYGLSGEVLTLDWPIDHPHHRGIYWAWPEVMFNNQMGDLHALQRVFARPVGKPITRDGATTASIAAASDWMWDDKTPIVHEIVTIRAENAGPHGRRIDLAITLNALVDGVSIARRGTAHYGGLNTRLAPAEALVLSHHLDSDATSPRMAWQTAAGTWDHASHPATVTIFEKATNSCYPAEHVEYPDLAWFQPAFPGTGQRQSLIKGQPLVLQYRFLIQREPSPDPQIQRDEWQRFNNSRPPQP